MESSIINRLILYMSIIVNMFHHFSINAQGLTREERMSDFLELPSDVQSLYAKGVVFKAQKNFEDAAVSYENFIKIAGRDKAGFAFKSLGETYFDLGNYRESIVDYTIFIQYSELLQNRSEDEIYDYYEAIANRAFSKFKLNDQNGALSDVISFNKIFEILSKKYFYNKQTYNLTLGRIYYMNAYYSFIAGDKEYGCKYLSRAGELGFPSYDLMIKFDCDK